MFAQTQYFEEEEWTSGSSQYSEPGNVVTRANYTEKHAELFVKTHDVMTAAFEGVRASLEQLQRDAHSKLFRIEEDQTMMLIQCQPSTSGLAELNRNMQKVEKLLATFAEHAANLTHIKLTLARFANFVSPTGPLQQLVVPARPASGFARSTSPQHAARESYPAMPMPMSMSDYGSAPYNNREVWRYLFFLKKKNKDEKARIRFFLCTACDATTTFKYALPDKSCAPSE